MRAMCRIVICTNVNEGHGVGIAAEMVFVVVIVYLAGNYTGCCQLACCTRLYPGEAELTCVQV